MMKNKVKVEDSSKELKKKWDLPFPEQASVTIYNLRDNGSCFLKDSVEDFNLSK